MLVHIDQLTAPDTAELGAGRVVVNSGWGYQGEDEASMWARCRDHLGRLCRVAEPLGIQLAMVPAQGAPGRHTGTDRPYWGP